VAFVFLMILPMTSPAQPKRVQLGEEKTAAVNAMLGFLYPKLTTYWDIDVFVQAADGARTRIALTYVEKFASASGPEFVAGIQEWASEDDLVQIRRGNAGSGGHPAYLIAVTRDSSGVFHLVSSYALEPSHMLAYFNTLESIPDNPSAVVVRYQTIDLLQDKVVETSWLGLLDANIKVLQKQPTGVEIKDKGSKQWGRLLYIKRTSIGILITDPVANWKSELPCPQICEPSLKDLTGSN
jgi:hypothetical protein